jgi:AraC family transcriptional regulator of arabinose operon
METLNTAFVREILDNIKAELLEPVTEHRPRFMEILFELLCLKLQRSLNYEETLALSLAKKEHLENFRQIRIQMLEHFTENWTVEKMAQETYLCNSRFLTLYKEFFNASPIAELIDARIEHAKWLLTSTTLSIKQVSQQSGFKNVYYFSRKFKERVNCSPSNFRLQGLNIRK